MSAVASGLVGIQVEGVAGMYLGINIHWGRFGHNLILGALFPCPSGLLPNDAAGRL